jgi:hypothetical protein
MQNLKNTILLFIALFTISCRTDSGNEKLANASKNVGESAAKVVSGVKAGIEKVAKINIELSETLKSRGLSLGKTKLDSKNGGRHNMLNVYIIFDKKINKNVTVKVYNNQNEEIGRTKSLITGDAGDAKYFDFIFDKRTNIDRDYKITME